LILASIPLALANAKRSAIGSAPGERTKIIGVVLVESFAAPSRSNGGLSINLAPSSDDTNSLIPYTNFSNLNTPISISL